MAVAIVIALGVALLVGAIPGHFHSPAGERMWVLGFGVAEGLIFSCGIGLWSGVTE